MAGEHSNKYSAPAGPPPGYAAQVQSPQNTGGPYHAPNNEYDNVTMVPYDQQPHDLRAPDQAYGGYQQPPTGGYYNPQNPQYGYGQPGPGPYQGGYYGGGPPPQQQMYYAAPYGGQPGYYQDSRGMGGGAGGGICAGIMAALACCCCLDFIF